MSVPPDLGPTLVHPGPFDRVVVNSELVCVVDPRKQVSCWSRRQAEITFQPIADASDIEEIAAERDAICVRTTRGDVQCGGPPFTAALHPVTLQRMATLPPASSFVTFGRQVCVLDREGHAHCHDDARQAELGRGDVVELVAGARGACVREAGGSVRCAELVDGVTASTAVEASLGATAIALGTLCGTPTFCAATAQGAVSCTRQRWSDRRSVDFAECDVRSGREIEHLVSRSRQLTVAPFPDPSEWVARGPDRSCASNRRHEVHCWHDGVDEAPRRVPELDGVSRLAFGSAHVCGIRGGRVECSGADHLHQGDVERREGRAIDLALGANHSCVVDERTRRVACSGDDVDGQTSGAGAPGPPRPALEVPGVENAAHVTAGDHHTCALLEDGRVLCWGRNAEGQASPSSSTSPIAPTLVALPGPASVVSAGGTSTCAVVRGSVYCWGSLAAQLDGTPQVNRVTGIDDARGLGTGRLHACATTRGETFCWGQIDKGELGPNPPSVDSGECGQHGQCDTRSFVPSPMLAHRVFRPPHARP